LAGQDGLTRLWSASIRQVEPQQVGKLETPTW